MVAVMAREDYEDLQGEGLRPTLEDFDRLNQLALRLEDGAEDTPANHPRIGWAADVPFYEPTAAAIMWLADYADRVPTDEETKMTFRFFAMAHGRDPSAFDGLEQPRAIEKAVKGWLRKLPCTVPQMARACHWAAFGLHDALPAESPIKRDYLRRQNKTAQQVNIDRLEKLLASAAGYTGLRYFDLLAHTPSRLNAMVLAAQVDGGMQVSADTARLQVEYATTLAEIRTRLIKERDHVD